MTVLLAMIRRAAHLPHGARQGATPRDGSWLQMPSAPNCTRAPKLCAAQDLLDSACICAASWRLRLEHSMSALSPEGACGHTQDDEGPGRAHHCDGAAGQPGCAGVQQAHHLACVHGPDHPGGRPVHHPQAARVHHPGPRHDRPQASLEPKCGQLCRPAQHRGCAGCCPALHDPKKSAMHRMCCQRWPPTSDSQPCILDPMQARACPAGPWRQPPAR